MPPDVRAPVLGRSAEEEVGVENEDVKVDAERARARLLRGVTARPGTREREDDVAGRVWQRTRRGGSSREDGGSVEPVVPRLVDANAGSS
jgi:hypothetical protein